MNESIQNAINKIDSEAEKMGEPYGQIFASHIIDNYLNSEENAKKVMEKNLDECIKNIKNRARKEAHSGCAIISDDAVFDWLTEYYGFTVRESTDNIVNLFDLI